MSESFEIGDLVEEIGSLRGQGVVMGKIDGDVYVLFLCGAVLVPPTRLKLITLQDHARAEHRKRNEIWYER